MDNCSVYISKGFHQYKCSKKGKYKHKEKHYCGTHFPPNVEKRRDKIDAKYNKEWKQKTDKWEQEEKDKKELAEIKKVVSKPEGIPELVEAVKSQIEIGEADISLLLALRACGIEV